LEGNFHSESVEEQGIDNMLLLVWK